MASNEKATKDFCIDKEDWTSLVTSVNRIEVKVFNGLSGIPGLLRWLIGGVCVLVAAFAVSQLSLHVRVTQLADTLINHDTWGRETQEANIRDLNQLDEKAMN